LTGEGLFGRVYEVGARSSRILLITDLNSHVPVIIERSRQRAILVGDNSENPLLWYLDPVGPLSVGDRIVTSGEGACFLPGCWSVPSFAPNVARRGSLSCTLSRC
jgi:rod shape-determining protein MreC